MTGKEFVINVSVWVPHIPLALCMVLQVRPTNILIHKVGDVGRIIYSDLSLVSVWSKKTFIHFFPGELM